MSKLKMPEPYIGGISPESSSYQASDDAATLARTHTILRSPVRVNRLQVHLDSLKSLISGGQKLRKVPIKGIGIRSIGGKR